MKTFSIFITLCFWVSFAHGQERVTDFKSGHPNTRFYTFYVDSVAYIAEKFTNGRVIVQKFNGADSFRVVSDYYYDFPDNNFDPNFFGNYYFSFSLNGVLIYDLLTTKSSMINFTFERKNLKGLKVFEEQGMVVFFFETFTEGMQSTVIIDMSRADEYHFISQDLESSLLYDENHLVGYIKGVGLLIYDMMSEKTEIISTPNSFSRMYKSKSGIYLVAEDSQKLYYYHWSNKKLKYITTLNFSTEGTLVFKENYLSDKMTIAFENEQFVLELIELVDDTIVGKYIIEEIHYGSPLRIHDVGNHLFITAYTSAFLFDKITHAASKLPESKYSYGFVIIDNEVHYVDEFSFVKIKNESSNVERYGESIFKGDWVSDIFKIEDNKYFLVHSRKSGIGAMIYDLSTDSVYKYSSGQLSDYGISNVAKQYGNNYILEHRDSFYILDDHKFKLIFTSQGLGSRVNIFADNINKDILYFSEDGPQSKRIYKYEKNTTSGLELLIDNYSYSTISLEIGTYGMFHYLVDCLKNVVIQVSNVTGENTVVNKSVLQFCFHVDGLISKNRESILLHNDEGKTDTLYSGTPGRYKVFTPAQEVFLHDGVELYQYSSKEFTPIKLYNNSEFLPNFNIEINCRNGDCIVNDPINRKLYFLQDFLLRQLNNFPYPNKLNLYDSNLFYTWDKHKKLLLIKDDVVVDSIVIMYYLKGVSISDEIDYIFSSRYQGDTVFVYEYNKVMFEIDPIDTILYGGEKLENLYVSGEIFFLNMRDGYIVYNYKDKTIKYIPNPIFKPFDSFKLGNSVYFYLHEPYTGAQVYKLSFEDDSPPIDSTAIPTFTVYPNPTTEFINYELSVAGSHTFTIYDQIGRIVTTGKDEDSNGFIDVSEYQSGLYLIEVNYGDQSSSSKFIKM